MINCSFFFFEFGNKLFGLFEFGIISLDFSLVLIIYVWFVFSINSFKYEFSYVVSRCSFSIIMFEIIMKDVSIFVNVIEVDCFVIMLEKEEVVKVFEEGGVRLVDGVENSLVGGGEFFEEMDDVEGVLVVEIGSGFVKEEKQFWFGS